MYFLKLNFQVEGHLDAIHILTVDQNGRVRLWENSHICWKMSFLKLVFWDEGHLHANFLFFILTIYCNFLYFNFFGWDLGLQISI